MNAFRLNPRPWVSAAVILLALPFLSSSAWPDPAGKPPVATYYIVPLHGAVGRQITAPILQDMLQGARKANPDLVVLEIESPGGHVAELEGLLKLIADAKDLKLVAFVKTAPSVATPLALACRDVYVVPSATLGGPFSFAGGPAPPGGKFDEKFLSMWRASCRSAVQLGAHSPLLAEGLIDPAVELSLADDNGKPLLVMGSQGKSLKKSGVVLTLSAKDAVASGLAVAEVAGYPALGIALGLPNWRSSGTGGMQILSRRISELDRTEADLAQKAGGARVRISRWANYLAAKPQIDKFDQPIAIPVLFSFLKTLKAQLLSNHSEPI